MRITVGEVVSGTNAELFEGERYPVPSQRLHVGIKGGFILAGMKTEVGQHPTGLSVAQRQPVDMGCVVTHGEEDIVCSSFCQGVSFMGARRAPTAEFPPPPRS